MADRLTVVIVAAHPDDCEYAAGALTARYRHLDHRVIYITMTNGNAGHHFLGRDQLKKIRYQESRKVAKILDIDYMILDIDDGCLTPSLKNRFQLIKLLRKCKPDLIITHHPNDYHPDHRYTSQLVADTAYMLNVPLCVPEAPIVKKPVCYCYISYSPTIEPVPTVLVPVDKFMDKKTLAFHQNTSQVYQWLPWTMNIPQNKIPEDENKRIEFLKKVYYPDWKKAAQNYYKILQASSAAPPKYIEAFTACPFGSPLTQQNARKYFPFADAIIF